MRYVVAFALILIGGAARGRAHRLAAGQGRPRGRPGVCGSLPRRHVRIGARRAVVVVAFVLVAGLTDLPRSGVVAGFAACGAAGGGRAGRRGAPAARRGRTRSIIRATGRTYAAPGEREGLERMCGIVGVVAHTPVNQLLYDGLLLLQHRGQDAAGIVTSEGPMFHMYKGPGYVRDVFRTRNMRDLMGNAGIGALPLSHGGLRVLRARVAAVLRQLAVRHHARAQRQPHQQRGAEARALPARLPPRQHQLRQRGAAERAGARARARGAASPARPRRDLQGGRGRAQALPRRVRGGRDDRRLRHARVPRSVRHPAAHHRRATKRWAAREYVVASRIGRARAARLLGAARRRARRGDLRRPDGQLPRAPVRGATRRSIRASSSSSTSRGPIR